MECPVCGTAKIRRNGHNPKGKQRYLCANGHTFQPIDDYTAATKKRVKKLSEWWFK
jgi:transposase-like protein